MKKTLTYLLVLTTLLSLLCVFSSCAGENKNADAIVWDGQIASKFAGGNGTEEEPYLISSGAQLAYLAQELNTNSTNNLYDKHYKLTRSIDLGGQEWTPIGVASFYNGALQGSFDGNGHSVSNFRITSSEGSNIGLFGLIRGGTVKDLSVTDFQINVSPEKRIYAGAIAGEFPGGTLNNCSARNGSIHVTEAQSVGGLVGRIYDGTITDCSAEVSVYGESDATGLVEVSVGGLIGWLESSEATDCSATGDVTLRSHAPDGYAGGLIGQISNSTLTNCHTDGTVSSTFDSVADETGPNIDYVLTCSGGLVGYIRQSTIQSCYTKGTVTADSTAHVYAGGIGAYGAELTTIRSSYSAASVSAATSGKESNFTASGSYAGGIIGLIDVVEIFDCYTTGEIEAVSTGELPAYAGGIAAGTTSNIYCELQLADSFATGDISASSGFSDRYTLTGSYAGGLVGKLQGTAVNCFATGNITGTGMSYAFVGGLVGSGTSSLSNCYKYEGQRLTVSDADNESSSDTVDATCTLSQLDSSSFYRNTLGWNTEEIWTLSELDFDRNQYPTLLSIEKNSEISTPLPDQIENKYCGENLTWKLSSDGVLTISGTGDMEDYTKNYAAPWNASQVLIPINTVRVEEGVTSIGSYAFADLPELEEVSLPSSLRSIGEKSFSDCYELEEIHYNGNLFDWIMVEKADNWDSYTGDYSVDYVPSGLRLSPILILLIAAFLSLIVSVLLALIPAKIAKKKGYSFGLFWLFGFGVLPAAIIVACCLPNKNRPVIHGAAKWEVKEETEHHS